MFMVMYVLDDPYRLDDVLDAWQAVGVSGTTVIESTGTHRRQQARARVGARFSFGGLQRRELEDHYTLFTIVVDEAMVQRCLAAVESVIGDLDGPHTGVLAAWPLTVAEGIVDRQYPQEATE